MTTDLATNVLYYGDNLILRPRFGALFTPEERALARDRLTTYGSNFPTEMRG
jgi:hypothetical protein